MIQCRFERAFCIRFTLRVAVIASLAAMAACAVDDNTPDVVGGGGKADDAAGKARRAVRPYVQGEIIVRFAPGVDARDRSAYAYRALPNMHVVKLPAGQSVESALAEYRADSSVLYAEPNYIYSLDSIPNDPRFGDLWGLSNDGQQGGVANADIGAALAWDLETGSADTVVAVIDTGINYLHEDLAANVWVNPGEIAGNGIDDDGNGYIDDIHGINAITQTGDPMDDHSHGSHVSGTIAAVGNNGIGVVGVNWTARLVGCKIFDANGDGATLEVVLRCMDYVLDLKTRSEYPVDIVGSNNSWGGGEFSLALRDAIRAHGEAGMLFVAAAGNDGEDNDLFPHYPSSYDAPNIISVASTTYKDGRSGFSNYGRRSVDVAAPGSNIVSTVLGQSYASYSGTSMASPHVAGLMALIKSHRPELGAQEIRNLILAGGEKIASTEDTTLSGRRIRALGPDGGSLACDNRVVRERLSPAGKVVFVGVGKPLSLGYLDIDCERAVEEAITVSVEGEDITLVDERGDGTYAAEWTARALGTVNLAFSTGEVIPAVAVPTYEPAVAVPYEYRDISGTNLGLGDDAFAEIEAPFPLSFGRRSGSPSRVLIGSNGNISFTDQGPVKTATGQLPSGGFETVVAPLWNDLDPSKGGGVYTEVLGEAPDRELVIEWRDVPHFEYGGAATFQVVLFEATSEILFNYKDVTFGNELADGGADANIGIQVAPLLGERFSSYSPSVSDGTSLRWFMSAPIAH